MRRGVLVGLVSLSLGCSSRVPAATAAAVRPTVDDMLRTVALDGVLNVRDLGGLRGSHGVIPHERFYRSATLVHASAADRALLLERGVTLDIDLRSFLESDWSDDRLQTDPRFSYRRISLLDGGISDWFRAGNLRGLYLHTLEEHQDSFRDVFHTMAAQRDGAVLYHCTSGKDRTGMVTAILLDLAGVQRDTIVRDYAISASSLHRDGSASPPSAIEAFLDTMHTQYGGARGYLEHIGLSESDIHVLLEKLGQA